MALALKTNRNWLSGKVMAAGLMIFALVAQPLTGISLSSVFAASLAVSPNQHVIAGNETKLSSADASAHRGLTFSFDHVAEALEKGDELQFGWKSGGNGESHQLGTIVGAANKGNQPGEGENGSQLMALPAAAQVANLQFYFTNTGDKNDDVTISNITLKGEVEPALPVAPALTVRPATCETRQNLATYTADRSKDANYRIVATYGGQTIAILPEYLPTGEFDVKKALDDYNAATGNSLKASYGQPITIQGYWFDQANEYNPSNYDSTLPSNYTSYIKLGNASTVTLVDPASLQCDTSAPTITVTDSTKALPSGSYFDPTKTIRLSASDDQEGGKITYFINDKKFRSENNGQTFWIQYYFNQPENLATERFAITAVDQAGNVSNEYVVMIDRTAPKIEVTDGKSVQPSGSYFGKNSIIRVNVIDANDGQLYVNGEQLRGYTAGQTFTIQYLLNVDKYQGVDRLVLSATDKYGNTSAEYVINLDLVAPSAEFSFSNNGALTRDDVTVTMKTNEPIATPDGWTEVDATAFTKVYSSNGNYTVTAADRFGNSADLTFEVTGIDKEAPAAPTSLSWRTSDGKPLSSGDATNVKSGTASWGPSSSDDVAYYTYKYWNDIENNPYKAGDEYKVRVDGTSQGGAFTEGEGVHHYCVEAVDKVGNVSECVKFTVIYDKTAPVATITSNVANPASGTVELVGTVSDANPMNSYFRVVDANDKIVARSLYENGRTTHAFSLDTTTLANGEYKVYFEARDKAGNKDGNVPETGQSVVMATLVVNNQPTDPVEPTDPTDPTDPVDPGDPTDPTDPTGPVVPTNPTTPVNPFTPIITPAVAQQASPVNVATPVPVAANRFLAQASLPGSSVVNQVADSDAQTGEVLGATDDAATTSRDNESAVVGASQQKSSSLAWYWWLLIVAVVGALLWWLIAAWRRRTQEDDQPAL